MGLVFFTGALASARHMSVKIMNGAFWGCMFGPAWVWVSAAAYNHIIIEAFSDICLSIVELYNKMEMLLH